MSIDGVHPHSLDGVEFGSLIVNGKIDLYSATGKKREMLIVKCNVCEQDPELHKEGYYIIDRSHLVSRGVKPCGCADLPRWKEWQYIVLATRAANNLGQKFIGWAEPFKKSYTRCLLECPVHGRHEKVRLNGLINSEKGCARCWYENAPLLQPKPDNVMIESFLSSGNFPQETVFYRSDRKSNKGKKIYWFVECQDCGTVGESTSSDLQAGKRPCYCSIKLPKYSYLLLLTDNGADVCLKLGVSSNFTKRLKDLVKASKFKIEVIGVWEYLTPLECRKAELECLRQLPCGVIPKELITTGYTETTSIEHLETIIKIFEENGGIRLTI